MTKRLTDEEIANGLRLAAAATPGEWIIHWNDRTPLSVAVFDHEAYATRRKGDGSAFWHHQIVNAWYAKVVDLEFIAAARTILPAALTELQSLRTAIRAERDRLIQEANEMKSCDPLTLTVAEQRLRKIAARLTAMLGETP